LQIFTWINCYADILAGKHSQTIRSYYADIVRPSLLTLEQKADELLSTDNPGDVFDHSDILELISETKIAFCLAIQSIWERQFRDYVKRCEMDLNRIQSKSTQIQNASWRELQDYFHRLRDISVETFPSFNELDNLQLLGNACRHGDGRSSKELYIRLPQLWQVPSPIACNEKGYIPAFAQMDIPCSQIESFVEAIAEFWNDTYYIYHESLKSKRPSLEEMLAKERSTRKWIPIANCLS